MRQLRSFIGRELRRVLCRPSFVRHAPQTCTRALMGCVAMAEATGSELWIQRARYLAEILARRQNRDGGFDTGYHYNFGVWHRPGYSLSCESCAVLALHDYTRISGDSTYYPNIIKGIKWIVESARLDGEGYYLIPYSPHEMHDVVIINGNSFAAGSLGVVVNSMQDKHAFNVYKGMVSWLDKYLDKDPDIPGRFWYYSFSGWGENDDKKRKIDYYHQMMQVEMHARAQQFNPVIEQNSMIRDAANHCVAIHLKYGVLPYCNTDFWFDGLIHTWGLSSVIPALLETARVITDEKKTYYDMAIRTADWLLRYAWNGSYFFDVISPLGEVISRDYMVRSDAWAFQAMAWMVREGWDGPWKDMAMACYNRMESVDFSGPEKHGINSAGYLSRRIMRWP